MPPGIPIATYRLQLTPQFGFDRAAAVVPYLKTLGISHVYASPFLKARAGTTHGYDIVDHNAFNPEFGGEEAFLRLSDVLREHDLGLILDFVPNHMAVHGADNVWWLDVLEWGPRSRYAKFFDIDWDTQTGQPRVLLPILGRPYGEVLESGEIELRYDAANGTFSAWYLDHCLPIAPSRYGEILQKVVSTAEAQATSAGRHLLEFAARFRGPRQPPPDKAPAFKQDIARIRDGQAIIDRGLDAYRPNSGLPGAMLTLHYLLERQHYRLAYWRLAGSDINYRRFFDINTLAALRVEESEVFRAIHRLVFRLIRDGRLDGLRLDHIDGLADPHQYLRRLQREIQALGVLQPFYIVIEKILAEQEPLPRFAGVMGTTGYEWLNTISRTLLEQSGLAKLDQAWLETRALLHDFDVILRQSKQRVLQSILSSEFTVLAGLLARIAAGHYSTRDFTAARLREALELFVLNFPVYRTYITAAGPSPANRSTIQSTIDTARAEWFGPDVEIFEFLRQALTLDLIAPGRSVGHSAKRVRRFAFKMQQFTGPMMAKSLEDTAFYRYHRLLALNEVGGDPAAPALPIDEFHARMVTRSARSPHGLTATATHDTKRGEDARARLLSLSELADEWAAAVREWRALNAPLLQATMLPRVTPAQEYMLYQTLLGAWPLEGIDQGFVQRVQAYAIKAAREGKQATSWIAPDEQYEAGLTNFVTALLDPDRSDEFLQSFDAIARRVALVGALRGLVQVTLKLTMPGVPDFYQGTEFWDLSLVDPDNRRPVDFQARETALKGAVGHGPNWSKLAKRWKDGRIKLALTRQLLALRRELPDLFARGDYRPVAILGTDSNGTLAFARTYRSDAIIIICSLRFGRITDNGRTWPSGGWPGSIALDAYSSIHNVLGIHPPIPSRAVPISDLCACMPVAVMRANE